MKRVLESGASRARLLVFATGMAVAMTIGGTVQAQDASLIQQLERLQRDMRDLQRTVYAGAAPPANATNLTEDPQAGQATARLRLQLQEIEGEMRRLTGRVEELGFQMNEVNTRVDKLISDVDYRLAALEGRAPSGAQPGGAPTASAQGVAPGTGVGDTTVITSNGATGPAAPGQQVLGQLTSAELAAGGQPVSGTRGVQSTIAAQPVSNQPPPAPPSAAPAPASVSAAPSQVASISLPEGDEKTQYQYAYGLLRQDLGQAEQAFTQFLAANESGPYSGNAMYWLGETHYARSDFRQAASVFVDAYTKYPESPKASASLLKLGMSLGALGKTEAACASFGELQTKFAESDPRVLQRAVSEAAKIGCPQS